MTAWYGFSRVCFFIALLGILVTIGDAVTGRFSEAGYTGGGTAAWVFFGLIGRFLDDRMSHRGF